MSITEADKIKLASFLDTEGFAGIIYNQAENRPFPMLQLTNTNKSWLEDIELKWGGKVCLMRREKPGYKTFWQWYIYGEGLLRVLETIGDYLTIKKESAKLAMELQHRIQSRSGRDFLGHLTPEERDYRMSLYRKSKQLTATGAH